MCYFVFFGILSVILTGVAYALLFETFTAWHPYLIWLVAINAATLVMYAIDSWMGRRDKVDPPEMLMHLLSIVGGFVGAWLARVIFRYRVDLRDRPWLYLVLVLSTIGHGVLVYQWLIVGL